MRIKARVKRIVALAATGALVLGLLPAGGVASADEHEGGVCDNAPAAPLTNKSETHGSNIDCLYAYTVPEDLGTVWDGERIFTGQTGGDANAFGDVTRGQAMTMLVKFALVASDGAIVDDIPDVDPVEFSDVDEDGTHTPAINVGTVLNLIQGYDGDRAGEFGPFDPILRNQFANILYEAHTEVLDVDFSDVTPREFPDSDNVNAGILAATEPPIIAGLPDGSFGPWQNISRGQLASMLVLSAEVLDDAGLWDAPPLPEPEGEVEQSFLDAPELVDVQFVDDNDTRTQLNFVFDEPVQPEFVSAQTFYMIAWNGAQIFAEVQDLRRLDEVVPGGADNVVRAAFLKAGPRYLNAESPDLGGQFQFGTTPRGYDDVVGAGVAAGAVLGLETELQNPPRSLGLQGSDVPGDFAYAPYITDVAVSAADNTVELEMSRAVDLTDPTNSTNTAITLWFNDNRGFTYGDGGNAGPDDPLGRRVARSFAYSQADLASTAGVTTLDLTDIIGNLSTSDAANLARVTLEPGVFQGANGAQNTLQSIDVATGTNGVTPDPDLIGYELDVVNDEVTFVFSETITDGITITDASQDDESQTFNGVPEFFQVHHVSSEHLADLAQHPWVAFPGLGARHGDPQTAAQAVLYAAIPNLSDQEFSGVVRGTDIESTDGNEAVVSFPPGSITKDITRVSVVSWMNAPGELGVDRGLQPGDVELQTFGPAADALDLGRFSPQRVNFDTADGVIRTDEGRYGVGPTVDTATTVGIADLAAKLDVLEDDGYLSTRGYGAVYATDGSGAPNVRMSIATPQSFEPLETIAPDPVGSSWDVIQRDNVDDSPQRYEITLDFDQTMTACVEEDLLEDQLAERNRRNATNANADGILLSLWEEDGSRTTVQCDDLVLDTNYTLGGSSITFTAGNNPQTDVFTLNEVLDAELLTIEFGSVDSMPLFSETNPLRGWSKPGLRNYGQALPVVTE